MWPCHISPHFLCFQLTITLCTIVITLIKLHSHLRAAKCQLQSNLILRCDTLHLATSSVAAEHYEDDDHEDDENDFSNCWSELDKVPRLSISDDICILSSDVICQLHQLFSNSEAAMLYKIWIGFFHKDIAGSPERIWVRDTDVLLLITTSQSQWRRGNVNFGQIYQNNGFRYKELIIWST